MKSSRKAWGFFSLFSLSTWIYATNPVPGIYAGVLIGGSYAPGVDFSFTNPITLAPDNGSLSYNGLGDIAGLIGYRICQYRVEAELLFNSSPFTKITANDITVTRTASAPVYFKGQTNFGAIMVNGFYDFYTPGTEANSLIPYVGVGIGYGTLRNSIKFYQNTDTLHQAYIPGTNFSSSSSTPAAQGIVGLSYFIDDFAALSLDYRYLSTKTIQPFNTRYSLNAINLTFSGALDFG